MEIGKHIREQAKKHHVKLSEVAKQLNINPTNFARLIDSENIKVKDLFLIANIIGCPVTDLLGIPSYQVIADNSVINVVLTNETDK